MSVSGQYEHPNIPPPPPIPPLPLPPSTGTADQSSSSTVPIKSLTDDQKIAIQQFCADIGVAINGAHLLSMIESKKLGFVLGQAATFGAILLNSFLFALKEFYDKNQVGWQ